MKINQELRHGKDMRRKVAYTKIVTGGDPFQYLKSISVMRKMKGPGRKVGEENGAGWIMELGKERKSADPHPHIVTFHKMGQKKEVFMRLGKCSLSAILGGLLVKVKLLQWR